MGRPRPQDAVALEPAEFARLFQDAVRAGESIAGDPAGEGSDPGREAPGPGVPDGPWTRAATVLRSELGDEEARYRAALWRFRALMGLVTRGALGPWVQPRAVGADASHIHPAVLDVASRLRLSPNGRFPARKFLAAVEETARERYPDLDAWPHAASPRGR